MKDFILDKAVLSEEEKKDILMAVQSLQMTQDMNNSQTLRKQINPDIRCQYILRKIKTEVKMNHDRKGKDDGKTDNKNGFINRGICKL